MYMIDDAGLRSRVALLAIDEVGPLGAVANRFGTAGARAASTSPMAADQMRSIQKRHLGALRADRPPIRPPHDAAKPTAAPAAVQFPAEQPAQTNLRGGEARRPRWRGERCTCLTSEVLETAFEKDRIGGEPEQTTKHRNASVWGRSNARTPKLLRCLAVAMPGLN